MIKWRRWATQSSRRRCRIGRIGVRKGLSGRGFFKEWEWVDMVGTWKLELKE